MKVKETALVVEDGDGAVVWPVGGRVMARVAGVVSIEAESVEVLEGWARRLVASCERLRDGAPSAVEGVTPVGRMMTWGDVRVGDEVWYRGRYVTVTAVERDAAVDPMAGSVSVVSLLGHGPREVLSAFAVKVRRAPVGMVA